VMGTVGYMSPEQVRGLPADHRSDIFSFGSILYEMVTGSRAFRGDSAAETMAAIAQKDPPELSSASQPLAPALDRIVRHCLEKNPAERFQSARDLAFDLETVTTTAGGSPVALPPAAQSRRRLLFATVGTAGLVLAYLLGSRVGGGRGGPALMFLQKTYRGQSIFRARFAPDGRTIVYSGSREGSVPELYSLRPEYPEPVSLGLSGVHLLSVSSAGELAVLTGAKYRDHLNFVGTLARMPLGGGAPREVLENVHDADWSPDGSQLAVLREVGGKDRLEFPIGTVVYEYAGYLSDVRVSPGGDRIAFLEHPVRYDNRGSAVIVDRTGRRLAASDAYWGEEGLAWTPRGGEVLFSAGEGLTEMAVRSLTPSGRRRVVSRIAGTLLIRDIARDGRWLATRDDSHLRIFGRNAGDPERDLSWLESAIAPILSRDGRMLLLTDQNAAAGGNYAACLRKTDGSPVVRLGEGSAQDLSPDGRSALVIVPSTPPDIRIYPTGAGSPKSLGNGGLAAVNRVRWLPDAGSLLVCGNEPGRGTRCYVMSAAGGALRPVTPEGGTRGLPSPDGRFVAASMPEGHVLFPIDGGPGRPLTGLAREERAIRWSPDGRSLWVSRLPALPARVESYDVATGSRQPIVEIVPDERTGVTGVYDLMLADDPKSYAYLTWQLLSYIFVVEEAK
jgi:eukaryotic-like serine/threonine-protein kinase